MLHAYRHLKSIGCYSKDAIAPRMNNPQEIVCPRIKNFIKVTGNGSFFFVSVFEYQIPTFNNYTHKKIKLHACLIS